MPERRDTSCTFYLARHGQTDMNVSGLIQGQSNSVLTDEGKEQAFALANQLNPVKFDAIFSSDLVRAKHTADIVATEHHLATQTTQLLRERAWGRLEGQPRSELKRFDDVYKSLSPQDKFQYRTAENVEAVATLALGPQPRRSRSAAASR
jgi:broad specificity phosphatase PhoE